MLKKLLLGYPNSIIVLCFREIIFHSSMPFRTLWPTLWDLLQLIDSSPVQITLMLVCMNDEHLVSLWFKLVENLAYCSPVLIVKIFFILLKTCIEPPSSKGNGLKYCKTMQFFPLNLIFLRFTNIFRLYHIWSLIMIIIFDKYQQIKYLDGYLDNKDN